jgi:hypothetical protein
MKPTESKRKSSAKMRGHELKIKPALLRGPTLLALCVCAAFVCATLPAAAQTLTVNQNPAYINDPLTFTYTPSTDPNACQPNWNETAKNYRDLTIYTGGTTQFDIPMSLNSDGVTYSGTYTTTSDDLGDNWVYVGDDICGNVASLEWAVIEFDGWFVYNATWVDDTDVAAVKAPGGSVEVDAMPFPLNLNAPSLYDWRYSDPNISWRSPIWGGYASRNNPYEYYYCVSLDDYQTYNWLNVWVISAVLKSVSFTSDYASQSGCAVMNSSGPNDWTDGSVAYSKPDWTPSNTNPICQAMGSVVSYTGKVNVQPPGVPFELAASSGSGFLDCGDSYASEANGSDQEFPFTSTGSLQNQVGVQSGSITWYLEAFGGNFEYPITNTGPHMVFVTYDTPAGSAGQMGNFVTSNRLARACTWANGQNTAANIVNTLGPTIMGSGPTWYPNNSILPCPGHQYASAWELIGGYDGNTGGDCISEAVLMQYALDMLGVTGSQAICIYPCHTDWSHLTSSDWLHLHSETDTSLGRLGYYDGGQTGWNNYEGTLQYESQFWPGFYGGYSRNSAKAVLYSVSSLSGTQNENKHQAYISQPDWRTIVSYPSN